MTLEQRRKRLLSDITRQKMSIAHKGKRLSALHKFKISVALKF